MSDSLDDKGIVLFGRDITKVPCFRNSYLYGILSGFGVGLMHFMLTSKPGISTHWAVGSFAVVTTTYWIQCRYKYSKDKFEMMRVQEMLRNHALYEGTDIEKELDQEISGSTVDV